MPREYSRKKSYIREHVSCSNAKRERLQINTPVMERPFQKWHVHTYKLLASNFPDFHIDLCCNFGHSPSGFYKELARA